MSTQPILIVIGIAIAVNLVIMGVLVVTLVVRRRSRYATPDGLIEPAPYRPPHAAGRRWCQAAAWGVPDLFLSCPCTWPLRASLPYPPDLCYTYKDTNSVPRAGPSDMEGPGAMWPTLAALATPFRGCWQRAVAGPGAPGCYHAEHIRVILWQHHTLSLATLCDTFRVAQCIAVCRRSLGRSAQRYVKFHRGC